MNKQNRLLLKAFKVVVKLAEASQKKQEYVQSSSRSCCHEIVVPRDLRAGGHTPKTGTPPSGKNLDGLWDTLVENGLKDRMETKYVHTLVFGKEQIDPQLWGRRDTVKSFAGDDAPYVEKLIGKVLLDGHRLVHVKCAELGTETLVALSPEGETLARIVKDNTRKYSKI